MAGRPSRHEVFRRLDEAMAELHHRLGGLPVPAEAEGIWTAMWHQDAHHSTAIEGNTLVLGQVERLLEDGVAVGNLGFREYVEVRSYADAAQWVYGQAREASSWADSQLITLTEVRQIHEMAIGLVWRVSPHPNATDRERPGGFREHDIRTFPGGMTPPPWTDVPAEIRRWIDRVNAKPAHRHLMEHVAAGHADFERIHPFLDGNGRTGRLVLNLVLVRLGYAPAIIYRRDRDRYLRSLRRADAGDASPLGELIARSVLDNLYRFVLPAVAGPHRLVPLPALATKNLTEGALRVAANRGRLRAQKGVDGKWRSTKTWVGDYADTRHRRQN